MRGFDFDQFHEPKTVIMPLCEHTMETAQSVYLSLCARYLLKEQAEYNLIPRWKFVTRLRAYYEMRGAIEMANHLSDAQIQPEKGAYL